jgi:hypothetical protein
MTTQTNGPATKGDLLELRDELRTHYATKADIANLEARLVKWMVGLMIGSVAAATALAVLVERLTN